MRHGRGRREMYTKFLVGKLEGMNTHLSPRHRRDNNLINYNNKNI
jgi:hypothetical protein